MNTSGSKHHTAGLALLAIALAAGGAHAQSHRDSGLMSETLRMRDAGRVSYPYAQGTVDASPAKLLPMLSLSTYEGDLGVEMQISGDVRHTIANFPKSADKAIVYVNIDALAHDKATMRKAYRLARDMGWPIYIESDHWNDKAVRAHVREYFPEAGQVNPQSVAVRISWKRGKIVVTRARPDDAAVEMGVPFSKTSRGMALEHFNRLQVSKLAPTIAKTTETPYQAGSFAYFGVASYNPDNFSYISWPYGESTPKAVFERVRLDPAADDFLQLWKADARRSPGFSGYCVVTWRGSSTAGDWLRNIQNQIGTAARIPNAPEGSMSRIGQGYAARLTNHQARVNGKGCTTMAFVGHSLGGGMAQAHSVSFRYKNPDNIRFWQLAAYNSARVGNDKFKNLARALIIPDGSATAPQLQVRCRNKDPIPSVPLFLYNIGNGTNGCTFHAVAVSSWDLKKNHSMNNWVN